MKTFWIDFWIIYAIYLFPETNFFYVQTKVDNDIWYCFQFQSSCLTHEGPIVSCRVTVCYATEIWSSVRRLMRSCISYIPFYTGSEKVIELHICCHSGAGRTNSIDANQKLMLSVMRKKKVVGRGFNCALIEVTLLHCLGPRDRSESRNSWKLFSIIEKWIILFHCYRCIFIM